MTVTTPPETATAPKPGAAGGLRDVVATTSAISTIDGNLGKLMYRGIDINDLAEHSTFEETTALLWYGDLPNARQLQRFEEKFVANRLIPNEVLSFLLALPRRNTPMGALRTAVSASAAFDPSEGDNSLEANYLKSIRVTSSLPTIVAAWDRIRRGLWPINPRPDLNHAANFLWMLRGEEPSETEARAMDVSLILHADHELNASTFAARVTASTLSNLHSAIVSAIGTLKGPLHGGANEQVMRTLLEIGDINNIEPYMQRAFSEKRKIMGFGHAVYKVDDPRSYWLRKYAHELAAEKGNTKWIEMSEKVREVVQANRPLIVNVDFYSASLYYVMGIPLDLFTPLFAISRVAGWTAHVYEQYSNNKLLRPTAEYIGPLDVPYTPIDERED
ncbi:MAG: citrate synthase [Chloroflexaceae bacterium]|nr:citrate synthase [Chloroflexaceae bacterium]